METFKLILAIVMFALSILLIVESFKLNKTRKELAKQTAEMEEHTRQVNLMADEYERRLHKFIRGA